MIFNALKNYWIVIFILTLASCTNINVVKIDQDLKRIDKFNDKGEFVKSYFKKFDRETRQWLLANCQNYNTKLITPNSNECEFTNMSLHIIRIAKGNDNSNSQISNIINIDTEQNQDDEEEQQKVNNEDNEDEDENNNLLLLPEDPPIEEECNDPTIC